MRGFICQEQKIFKKINLQVLGVILEVCILPYTTQDLKME